MSTAAPQTLENLRKSPAAAWLWDAARGRIVWANAAGISAFESKSLFDLVDRVFDEQESGIASISEMSESLQPGKTISRDLHFPSTGRMAAFSCQCSVYMLADGRRGILVVEDLPVQARVEFDEKTLRHAIDLLPAAVLFLDSDGKIISLNDNARSLLDGKGATQLAGLIESSRAGLLMMRLEDTQVVTSTEKINGKFGIRDVRMTFRRLGKDNAVFATVMLEDITDRLQLERQLAERAVPPTESRVAHPATSDDRIAFEHIARTLKQDISNHTPHPAASAAASPATQPAASTPERQQYGGRLPNIPEPIKQAMEKSGEAIIIAQKGRAVFATDKAAKLLEFSTGEDLAGNASIPALLFALQEARAEVKLSTQSGRLIDVDVISTSIPWLHGPARQFRIRPAQRQASRLTNRSDAAPLSAGEEARSSERVTGEEPAARSAETSGESRSMRSVMLEAQSRPAANEAQRALSQNAANEELRAILDVASDGIITLDMDGRILTYSAGAESIFGYSIGDVIGKPLVSLLSPNSGKTTHDYLAAMQGPGLASVFNDGREVTAMVKQGGTIPLFLTIGKLQSEYSDARFCAVVRDITPWKRTEEELRQAKVQAETANKQKSEFLARMGHELRTPINAILGFTDLMRTERYGEIKNEKYRGYLNDVHASATHLLSLINDLLDLSKVESGKLELTFAAVSIHDVIDYAIATMKEEAARNGVILRKSLGEKLPRVVADLRAMRQILLNLLSNAVKFTDTGGQVILSAKMNAAGEMVLRVRDSGIGMTDDQIMDALEPFKRIETKGREKPGTGLGLPLTKALVEANRARFDILSEVDKGTTIEITFPTTRVLAE